MPDVAPDLSPIIRFDVTSAQRTYPILVGAGLSARLASYLQDAGLVEPVIVSVPPVWRHHGERMSGLAGGAGPILMADGERAKTLQTVARLYDALASRRVARTNTLIGFGGGVVGDTAGFAAATYLRGVPFVQVPTTLLAQVDSAIGGKVGVNLAAGKNLAGAFYSPRLVVCDTALLGTLRRREFRAGLYEVVKYAVIASPTLFASVARDLRKLFARDTAVLGPLVAECGRIKGRVVESDEHEAGPRRVLNFGHTLGHAIETVTKYRRFRHGEAIAHGMLAAGHISMNRGVMPPADFDRLCDLIRRLGPLPTVADLHRSEILDAVTRDKKVASGRLHFVLSAGLGSTQIAADVTPAEMDAALTAIGVGN